jgi:ribosomal protein S12 methylthiotransferase accessory factor
MQARVSAAMESIETWHVENPVREPDFRATAASLDLPYDLRALNLAPRSPLTERCTLDWTTGTGLLSGQPVPVPLDSIRADFTGNFPWADVLFGASTNGVASGNTPVEATLHGLFEIMERDCIAEHQAESPAGYRYCDVTEATSEYVSRIVARLRDARCVISVVDITNRLGFPCYAARVWSADVAYRSGGYGCHVDAEIAVGRALLEAAQSRLGAVSGARDDISDEAYLSRAQHPSPHGVTIASIRTGLLADEPDLESVVRSCATRVAEVTGFEPFTVDLSHPDIGISVQKTYAPGLRMFDIERL